MAGPPDYRATNTAGRAASSSNRIRRGQNLATLLRQPVKIDAAIIVRHVDLTAVDHRRVEFVEQKLDIKSL
jgi:hypothetical protein